MRCPIALGGMLLCVGACDPSGPADREPCDAARIESSVPIAGSTNVFYRTLLLVRPAAPEAGTTLSLVRRDGTVLPGAVESDGAQWWFEPATPLASNTEYELVVSASCGDSSVPFRTGPLGAPLEVDPSGKVYELDLQGADWLEPRGLISPISGFIGLVEILARATLVDGSLELTVGHGTGGGRQDPEVATNPMETQLFEDPYVVASTDRFTIRVRTLGKPVHLPDALQDLVYSGAFSPDGSVMRGHIGAMVDVRNLVALMEEADDGPEACAVASDFGSLCEPCPLNDEPFCLPVVVEDIEATWLEGIVLVDVPEAP